MSYSVNAKVAEDALPAEVLELLGLPERVRLVRDHAAAFSWTLDEDGDGIGVARSATRAGLGGQVQSLLDLAARGCVIRQLVVAANMCGNRRFHERPDLLEVATAIESGWCRFVAVEAADRISRNAEGQTLFAEHLLETGVELVLASQGPGAVDLEELSLIAQIMSLPGAPREWRRRRASGGSSETR